MTNGTVVKKNDEWHWQQPSSKCGLALVLLILRLQKEWCCGSYGPNGVCIHWWAVLSPFAGATGSNQCALLPQEGWAWSRGPSPVSAKAPAAAATSPYCFRKEEVHFTFFIFCDSQLCVSDPENQRNDLPHLSKPCT